MTDQKTIFSGIQPSGNLHLGNYLGAIKNWVALQDEYQSIFCVVDLHAITMPQNPEQLRKKSIEVAKIYLAAGIDPIKSTIFIQSHVPEHTELAWILNTITRMSDLFRMIQFKDKAGIQKEKNSKREVIKKEVISKEEHTYHKTGVGLFDYPVLMAADILLYDADLVPVGEDQSQHVEITRTLGKRFNSTFGETFNIPQVYMIKEGMRIMGLDDPIKKMSKSVQSKYNRIDLLDSPDEIREKIMKAVTDSGNKIEYGDNKPAIKNLLNIFALVTDSQPTKIAARFEDKGYKEFKETLADAVIEYLTPLQKRYHGIPDTDVQLILAQGAKKLAPLAKKKMIDVKEKLGFVM